MGLMHAEHDMLDLELRFTEHRRERKCYQSNNDRSPNRVLQLQLTERADDCGEVSISDHGRRTDHIARQWYFSWRRFVLQQWHVLSHLVIYDHERDMGTCST